MTELVWCRIANPRSGETLRGFKSLRPRQRSEGTCAVSNAHYGGAAKRLLQRYLVRHFSPTIWGIATRLTGGHIRRRGRIFPEEPKGCKTPMPLLMIFLAALHRLTSIVGERPGYGPGVLLLYKREDLWYKKIDPGFVVVPVVSFHRLEFCFFLQPERSSSWRALLLFAYAAAAVRLMVELVAACHRLAVGAASAITYSFAVKSSPAVILFLCLLEKICCRRYNLPFFYIVKDISPPGFQNWILNLKS